MLRPGIYELPITRNLADQLDTIPEARKATAAIDQAEASSVLSAYVAQVVRRALELTSLTSSGTSNTVKRSQCSVR